MRRVPVDQLKTGDRIGKDVYARPDAPALLRSGVRVSDSYRDLLTQAGVVAVWIDDKLSDGIEPLEIVSDGTKLRTSAAIRDAFQSAGSSLAQGRMLSPEIVKEMANVVELIVSEVAGNVHAALALNDLANADGYTMKHSLAVTTLGLSIGLRVMQRFGWVGPLDERRFDGIDERLLTLGVGLLVHDIGKLAVPIQILHKPGPLTDAEWVAMKAHPVDGVRILQHASISPLTRAVVRSHHEKWDGTGYPSGTAGTHIHQFPRIAAVADVFDALASVRHYRPAWPMHEAWQFIVDRAGQDFDPEVVDVFRTSVAPFPPGTAVVLSDGSCGIVKEVKQTAVMSPIVRVVKDHEGTPIPSQEIDLSVCRDLTIVSTDCNPWDPRSAGEFAPLLTAPRLQSPLPGTWAVERGNR